MPAPTSFVLIVDNDGNPREVFPGDFPIEEALKLCEYYRTADDADDTSEYTAWRFANERFDQLMLSTTTDSPIWGFDLFSNGPIIQ